LFFDVRRSSHKRWTCETANHCWTTNDHRNMQKLCKLKYHLNHRSTGAHKSSRIKYI